MHEIHINASPETVYKAWTTEEGLSSWWTGNSHAPNKVGKINVFVFDGGSVEFHFQVDQQKSGQYIHWTGVKSEKMPDEWVDTVIEVELQKTEHGTRMRFQHKNWKTDQGMYCVCNTTWGELMYRLKDYCENDGRGPLFNG
jgi:uncharacterized protein YndB with AHSA1/START domain